MAPHLTGVNIKSVEARERRAALKEQRRENERKRLEDAQWHDEVSEAKLAKKAEPGVKHQERMQRKAELKALSEKEEAQFTSNKKSSERPGKLTRSEIQQRALLAAKEKKLQEDQPDASTRNTDAFDLQNPNRLVAQEERLAQEKGQEYIIATSPEEFLSRMGTETLDRFPTKRLRAAYCAYEVEWLERLKQEFPSLTRSQLKEKIWKQWQKAPENPLNQPSRQQA